jgi:transposase
VEKLLGALPVVAWFSSRLKIRDIVDDACPVRDLAELTHGQVIEALVANRLTAPSPLVHVQSRARDWAVGEALGVEPGLLNDDRIGRALDAIAPHLDQIAGSVGVTAIKAFGIDVSRLHWDMTSISVHGQYAQHEEGFAAPKFGHPEDRRPDLKQVQTGIAVSGDGGIPVFHRALDGGAGEVSQVIPVMKALQAMATQRRLLIVGDSRLVSYANLAAMDGDTTSLRLPAEVISQLRRQASAKHVRYTSYVRSILERAALGGTPPEIAEITERLERIERAVTSSQTAGDQKTA